MKRGASVPTVDCITPPADFTIFEPRRPRAHTLLFFQLQDDSCHAPISKRHCFRSGSCYTWPTSHAIFGVGDSKIVPAYDVNNCSSARSEQNSRLIQCWPHHHAHTITPPTLEEPGSHKAAGAEGPPSGEAGGAGVAFKNIPRGVQHARDEPAGTAGSPAAGDKPLRARGFQRRLRRVRRKGARCRCAAYGRWL